MFTARRLVPLVWIAAGLSSAALPADDLTLLSGNATYRLAAGGYVYTGQIQPGVNARALQDGMVMCPLVEPTDTGDELIDGDRSDASSIHTAWFWNATSKRVVIEMKLPGPSTVRRVRVTFPRNTNYRPGSVRLETGTTDGAWQDQGRQFVHRDRDPVEQSPRETTFELQEVRCRMLKFTIGGRRQHVGVTEIEVWGTGPTAADRRGLIRSKPHTENVERPVARVPTGAVRLSTAAEVHLQTSHDLSDGAPADLTNGKRGTGIRVGTRPHQHITVTATLDLKKT